MGCGRPRTRCRQKGDIWMVTYSIQDVLGIVVVSYATIVFPYTSLRWLCLGNKSVESFVIGVITSQMAVLIAVLWLRTDLWQHSDVSTLPVVAGIGITALLSLVVLAVALVRKDWPMVKRSAAWAVVTATMFVMLLPVTAST